MMEEEEEEDEEGREEEEEEEGSIGNLEGRLLPEYRPAKSYFVSYLHSNSHKKVMEMRMALPPSVPK
ncbi:hypothetical protein LWI29_022782 [Acer saccharum]|uniref:Uncharacterized protein n=1 Tax=Acer saccharum TaxID=4024 RepID=A0AA39VWI0_ACESA|nr:hypothetical protein LWI29_022782 [Acer saccharum]